MVSLSDGSSYIAEKLEESEIRVRSDSFIVYIIYGVIKVTKKGIARVGVIRLELFFN